MCNQNCRQGRDCPARTQQQPCPADPTSHTAPVFWASLLHKVRQHLQPRFHIR